MKKTIIISSIILVIAIVLFAVSVPITGVREGTLSLSIGGGNIFGGKAMAAGEVAEYSFPENINNIEVATASADTKITLADISEAKVTYKTETGGLSFKAFMDGDTLRVEETGGFLFLFHISGESDAELEITLPKKEYNDVEIVTASGNTDIDQLICDEFNSVVTSGNSEYDIFARDIDIYTTSGSVNVRNCTDRIAEKLTLSSTSGVHSVKGFKTSEYEFVTTSGVISADELSGRGQVNLVSGEIYLTFAEWNGDIEVDGVSGSLDMKLPENSGVAVNLDAVSGGVRVALGENNTYFSGESNTGNIGGENSHVLDVDLVSGEVYVHD